MATVILLAHRVRAYDVLIVAHGYAFPHDSGCGVGDPRFDCSDWGE